MTSKKFSLTEFGNSVISRFLDQGERVLLSPRGGTVSAVIVITASAYVVFQIVRALMHGALAGVIR
jgi:hypothetical protein